MKTKRQILLLLVFSLLFCAMQVCAQTPIEKYFTLQSSGGFVNVEQLSQGGYIAVGNVNPGVNLIQKIWLVRMNEQGDTLWTRSYYASPFPGWDWGTHRSAIRLRVASDGGFLILSYNDKSQQYGGTAFNSIMKVNANGDSLWSVSISNDTDYWVKAPFNDIIATTDGGCLAAGAANDGKHAQLMKMSSKGTTSWTTTAFPAVDADRFNTVCVTSDGGFIAVGVEGYFDARILIAKVSSAGSTLWAKTYYSGNVTVGDRRRAEALSVAPTTDGGCLLTGYVTDPGTSNSYVLLMRFSAAGDSLWTKTFFGQGGEGFTVVQLSPAQYLMYLQKNAGFTDAGATVLKLNASGDSLWSQVGYAHSIMMNGIDREGGILLTGYTGGVASNIAVLIRTTAGGVYRPPALLGPSNNSTGKELRPILSWSGQPHLVFSTRVQVARDTGFSSIRFDSSVTSNIVQVSQLLPSTKFFWRAQSYGKEGGPTQWSEVWNFTTVVAAPQAPTLAAPADSARNVQLNTTLSWNAATGATSYHLQVSTSSSFTATVVDDSTLTSTSKQIGPLSNNTKYYWRVNAKNEAGISDWSQAGSFTTMAAMQGRSLADVQPFPYEDPWWSSPSNVGFNPIGVTNSIVLTLFRGNDTLYSIVSSDTGMTWSARQFVRVLGPSVSTFRAVRLNSGRILLTWRDNDGIKTSFSDNNGGSFPATTTIAAALNTPYEISQTDDSRVWLSYTRSNGSNSDSFFLISIDSGKTWGSERTLANTSGNESGGVFFSGTGSTVVGMFSSYVAGNRTFLYSQGSSDSGLTWSAPTKVFNDTLERFTPHVLKNSSGTLTLVCSVNNYRIYSNFLGSVLYPGGYARSDIFTYSSANNGSTWTQPTQFTRYAGSDNNPLTGLVGDRVFISFLSARWVSGNAWYGIAGRTLDMTAPPFVSYVSIPSAEPGVRCDAQIEVFDAAGIKDAKVSYVLRGVTYGPFQLYDDGAHNDYNANDGTYGGPTGLFSVGDSINMTYTITSNTLSYIIWTRSAINPAVHNTGNVKLAVNSNSLLGSNGNNYSGTWPKANGTNYLNIAGLWVGGLVGGAARVLKAGESGACDWHQTAGSSFALAPGISDQDISVTYDDSLATSTTPLGIRVFQKSYVWASASRSDFVILTYRVVNRGTSGKIDSVFVGLWADGDVQPSPATNASGYDATRNLLYVTNSTRTGGMIGIRLLGPKASLRTARSYDFYGVPAFTDSAYMVMIKSGYPGVAATLGDYRVLATAQPFPLAGGQSSTVAFGTVFGNGLAALQANADTMEAVYEGSVLTAPRLRLNTAKMDIGLVLLGKSKDTTITISNTGSDTLRISTINNSLPGITIRPTFLSIPPNGFAVDTIRFAPTVVGPISGALLILSNAPTSPDTVRVTASGVTGTTGIVHEGVPQAFGVEQNYPNPFNPSTMIRYELPKPAIVSLKIYSTLGQLLATLEDAKKEAGYYQVQWNASNVPSGVYFYRLQAGEFVETKKMILLR